MIGRITMLWVGLAAGVATGLFQLKHEVQALEGRLLRINRAILADQQAVHVLKAEWSYLNQPSELGKRALENLALKPVTAAQLGQIADVRIKPEGDMIAEAPVPPALAATLKGPAMSLAKAPEAPVLGKPAPAAARTVAAAAVAPKPVASMPVAALPLPATPRQTAQAAPIVPAPIVPAQITPAQITPAPVTLAAHVATARLAAETVVAESIPSSMFESAQPRP